MIILDAGNLKFNENIALPLRSKAILSLRDINKYSHILDGRIVK